MSRSQMSGVKVSRQRTGFLLRYGNIRIGLDTGIADGPTLLSHSHTDHTQSLGGAREVIATKGTLDTLAARGGRLKSATTVVEYGRSIFHGNVVITALDAGHVLGSTMFLIEFDDGATVLYTGDFNNVDSLVHTRAQPTKADVLVMEATYGSPEWVFPSRERVYGDIVRVAREVLDSGRIPRFHAYSLGKAQEAIALLHGEGFEVLAGNGAIDTVSRVYSRHGIDLQYVTLDSAEARRLIEHGCTVVSSSTRHMYHNLVKVVGSSVAQQMEALMVDFDLSGWSLPQYGSGGLPLSAHTDYPGLIQFAKNVDPVITYCFTENARVLAEALSRDGLPAVPLE